MKAKNVITKFDGESERAARWHAEAADSYAERSHETEGELSDAYSAAAEAHNEIARAIARKADVDLGRDR